MIAEHHVLYQYNLYNAKNHYMGLIQTESVSAHHSLFAPASVILNLAFCSRTSSPSLLRPRHSPTTPRSTTRRSPPV